MTRNTKGIIGWTVLGLVLGFLIPEAAMIGREIYQKKKYFPDGEFEWDDIGRYTIAITAGAVVHWAIAAMIFQGS